MTAQLFLGVGLASRAEPGDLAELADCMVLKAGFDPSAIAAIATIDTKVSSEALSVFCHSYGRKVIGFSAERLDEETPRLWNPSEKIYKLTGCHGVAEAAALASAGPSGRLIIGKTVRGGITMALAIGAPEPAQR